jgi:hypothetical protein
MSKFVTLFPDSKSAQPRMQCYPGMQDLSEHVSEFAQFYISQASILPPPSTSPGKDFAQQRVT